MNTAWWRNSAWWLNTAWMGTCGAEATAFRRATFSPANSQWSVLRDVLRTNVNTEFGRKHGFAAIRTREEFRVRVPIADYDAFTASIGRIAAGEQNILTREAVRLFEPTSGSNSARKLIPYTAGLRRQYRRMIAPWLWDLYRHRPAVRRGKAYWSISPGATDRERTPAGIPIGFDDDTAYLGGLSQRLAARVMAVPTEVARVTDSDVFRDRTLTHLLAAFDLSLVSVWSPTFLTALFERLEQHRDRVLADLRRLTDASRSRHVATVLRSSDPLPAKLRRLWPELSLISCWADAAAGDLLPVLRRLFPDIEIQPKGLLATEGAVSFPLIGRPGAALALRSHFFEFEELDGIESARELTCRFADELDVGGQYSVVLTTAGGLYRYRLRDIIEVVGFENRCPLLRFCGRAGGVSDLVGEKLSEAHVGDVLRAAFARTGVSPRFALVVPIPGQPPHYRLYLQVHPHDLDRSHADRLVIAVESGLAQNPYYRQALRLAQLGPLDLRTLDPRGESGWSMFERHLSAVGRRLGDIKPVALDRRTDWPAVFDRSLSRSASSQRRF